MSRRVRHTPDGDLLYAAQTTNPLPKCVGLAAATSAFPAPDAFSRGMVDRTAGGADTLLSIAVSFTDDGSSTTSGTTFTPTVNTQRCKATAIGTYSISGPVDITTSVTWTSGSTGNATISNGAGTEGQITAVSANNGTSGANTTSLITATLGAVSGNNTVSIAVARDATSGIRCPVNAYQFSLLGYTVQSIYLCQETSGNLADSGPGGVTMTANASPLYDQTITGWTRHAIGFSGVLNQRFQIASGTGTNPNTTEVFWCWYMYAQTLPSTARGLQSYGTSRLISQINTTGAIRTTSPGFTADDTTTRPDTDDLVHPIGLLNDGTNTRAGVFTDEAKTLNTYASVSDGVKTIGPTGSTTSPDSPSGALYGFLLTGANARLSDANVKSLYLALGWTVPWP